MGCEVIGRAHQDRRLSAWWRGGWIRTSVGLPRRIYSRCALFEFIGKKGRKFATGVRQPAAISCDGASAGRRLPGSRYEPPLGRRIEIWVDEVGGAAEAFKKRLPERVAEVRAAHPGKRIELWFQDEARIWQKNKLTRRWAKRGTRPSAPHDQRAAWAAGHCPRTNGGQWLRSSTSWRGAAIQGRRSRS